MAYGTATVPQVDKIVGPGNKYVTAAKMAVFGTVDIDSPAGPSEALILADDTPDPGMVAMDFLSQVEHDPDAAAVLVTPEELARAVVAMMTQELPDLPRREIISAALKNNSAVLMVSTWTRPSSSPTNMQPNTCRSSPGTPCPVAQDQARGLHLPGAVRPGAGGRLRLGDQPRAAHRRLRPDVLGALVDDFIKKPTFQHLTREASASLKDTVITLAEHEGLLLHARAVAERFRIINSTAPRPACRP